MNIPTEAQEQAALFEWAHLMEGRCPELRLLQARNPSWAYVEGILKGGRTNGTQEHRGNHSGDHGKPSRSGKYDFLFADPA